MAVLTKQQLLDQTNAKIRANGQRLITGVVLNDVLIDLIDSVQIGGGSGLGTWSSAIQYSIGDHVVVSSQIWTAFATPTFGVFNANTEWTMISKPDTTVVDISERNSLTHRFVGMTIFVQSTVETFRLVGGTANTNWKKISETITTKTIVPITANGQINFGLTDIGEISHLEINGVRHELNTDFTWNGSVLTWSGLYNLATDDSAFLIHEI